MSDGFIAILGMGFFLGVITIVKLGISAAGSGNTESIISCVNCFVSGPEGKTEC